MSTCSATSALVGEPLAGTAPVARAWLAVEQSGPWGRQALTESHLDPDFGRALLARTEGTGVMPLLVRRPGRHADDHHMPEHRTVWLASSAPGAVWLRRLDVHELAEVLALDLVAIGAGTEPSIGTPDPDPLLLVCTNAKRDQCCAVLGRPAVHAADLAHPGRVWESSHLGGHRFAATALVLPYGHVHGRLTPAAAASLLDLATEGRIDLATLRGRSCWPAPGQAAEAHVRGGLGLDRVEDVRTVAVAELSEGGWSAAITLADGSVRTVAVRLADEGVARPESCVKPPVPLTHYRVEDHVGAR